MPLPLTVPRLALVASLLAGASLPAQAASWVPRMELSHTLLQTSLFTTHFSPRDEHVNDQRLVSLELNNPERWLTGAAWFKNSFDQPSWFVYGGRKFPLWEPRKELSVRAKLAAGLLRGYKGEYRDKIPLNRYGVAPAAVPSIGVRWGQLETDLIVFGTAGAMITAGIRF